MYTTGSPSVTYHSVYYWYQTVVVKSSDSFYAVDLILRGNECQEALISPNRKIVNTSLYLGISQDTWNCLHNITHNMDILQWWLASLTIYGQSEEWVDVMKP